MEVLNLKFYFKDIICYCKIGACCIRKTILSGDGLLAQPTLAVHYIIKILYLMIFFDILLWKFILLSGFIARLI